MIIKNVDILQNLFASDRHYELKNRETNDIILLKLILTENVNDFSRNGDKRIKKSIER